MHGTPRRRPGRFLSVDPRPQYTYLHRPQGWNRYAYTRSANPLTFIDPDGEALIISWKFRTRKLSGIQRLRFIQRHRSAFRRAGVKDVQNYLDGGSIKPKAVKESDRLVTALVTDEPIYATCAPNPQFQADGRRDPDSNVATIFLTARGAEFAEGPFMSFLVNTSAHEIAQTAVFDELGKYQRDGAGGPCGRARNHHGMRSLARGE